MHHAEEKGAKKANRIKTSGAFHTTAMAGAQETLSKMLDNMEIRLPEKIAVYSNVTGKPYTSVAEMRALLKRQVVEPVAWEASMKEIISQGVTKIVETGPGMQLKAMLKRTDLSAYDLCEVLS